MFLCSVMVTWRSRTLLLPLLGYYLKNTLVFLVHVNLAGCGTCVLYHQFHNLIRIQIKGTFSDQALWSYTSFTLSSDATFKFIDKTRIRGLSVVTVKGSLKMALFTVHCRMNPGLEKQLSWMLTHPCDLCWTFSSNDSRWVGTKHVRRANRKQADGGWGPKWANTHWGRRLREPSSLATETSENMLSPQTFSLTLVFAGIISLPLMLPAHISSYKWTLMIFFPMYFFLNVTGNGQKPLHFIAVTCPRIG